MLSVMAMLNKATEPLSAVGLASRFRQGRRALPQIEAALHAMLRVGGLLYSRDGGARFATGPQAGTGDPLNHWPNPSARLLTDSNEFLKISDPA
jgi:hypothetical protein